MRESAIIISSDLDFAKERILQELADKKRLKTFLCEEFKVEDAKAVTKEAYIAEEQTKYILLSAKSYNIYAQNALLKLLEEPPRNIVFLLLARSKTSLLPTIRSRLKITKIDAPRPEVKLDLSLRTLDLASIFTFVKTHQRASKEEIKEIVQALLKEALLKERLPLQEKTIAQFEKALHTADLYARPQTLLVTLLLGILEAKGRR
ncbi:MAG: hypothetical protein B6D59_04355 [Campylobacteraceae bacterium 4484_4]|nr:MAG: hypothetical protein B6D59_04355 [Campylobacteraceae bacterium 4484_4]